MLHTVWSVDPQHINGRTGDRCLPNQNGTVPGKVVAPSVSPRIEEGNELAGRRIISGDVRAFGSVAIGASPTEVLQRCWAVVLTGADVVEFVRQRAAVLGELAILAAVPSPFSHPLTSRRGHSSVRSCRLERYAGLRLEQIEELPHSEVLFQGHSLVARDRAPVVLLKQPADLLRGDRIESQRKDKLR
jgi:hypothetical protein